MRLLFGVFFKSYFSVSVIVYYFALSWSYYLLSCSAFSEQFVMDLDYLKFFIGFILSIYMGRILGNITRISGFFLKIIFFFFVIPTAIIYGMSSGDSIYFFLCYISILAVAFFLKRNIKINDVYILPPMKYVDYKKKVNGSCFCFVITLINLIGMYYYNGWPSMDAFILSQVYDVRDSYVSVPYLKYCTLLVSVIFIPLGYSLGVVNRRYFHCFFFLFAQLLLFLWTGNKTYLFFIIFIVILTILLEIVHRLDKFFDGLSLLATIGAISEITQNSISQFVFMIFNRRMILDPSSLKFFYYDFFIVKDNHIYGMEGTIFAPFMKMNDVFDYRRAISEMYTGYSTSANTGIFGGDFAAWGIGAFILVPLMLFVLLCLIEWTYVNCGFAFTISFYSYIVFRLNDISIFLLWGDLTGITLLLIYFMYFRKNHKFNVR